MEKERRRGDSTPLTTLLSLPDEEALWRAIHEIEDHDLVYKLLKRTSGDMSYPDIARELAEMLNVSAEHLTETSFLNVQDERLLRLANGSWTLKEFVLPPTDEVEPVTPPSVEPGAAVPAAPAMRTPHARRLWYVLAALITVAVLVWFLAIK